MKRALSFFIVLHFYALCLDGLALLVIGIEMIFLSSLSSAWPSYLSWVLAGGLWLGALRIHLRDRDKRRHYHIMMRINRKRIRAERFREFFDSPCYRLLAYRILKDLGHPEYYPILKDAFYVSPIHFSGIHVFNHKRPAPILPDDGIIKKEEA